MGLFRALLKIARGVVESIIGQVSNQTNIVQEQVVNQINRMVQQTMDGIWIGKGADAFVEEMTSNLMPRLNQVVSHNNMVNTNIRRSMEIIAHADSNAQSLANQVGDIYRTIF
ncbi:MAG: WXG100 family type VII secretion target [Anaerolineaceae bacterium]|nr:WXG100 family type VII secretion target [Anaerolineaceae bacterium]